LWRVSATVSLESEEAVMALVSHRFGSPPAAYCKAGAGFTTVSAFVEARPTPSDLRALRTSLRRLRECGVGTRPGVIRLRRIRREDWAESWKKHFPPLAVGRHLLIRPSWSRDRPARGQRVVVLDPGLSFGTGHHPTTWFCLCQVARHRPSRATARAFLDLGTGSGILAIAAAKLGYSPILAMDHDPGAIRVARQNLRRNRIEARVDLRSGDVAELSGKRTQGYDLVAANLATDVLLRLKRHVAASVKPGGSLVLAGILRGEFRSVASAYSRLGLELITRSSRGEWRSGCFRRPA
jgi:ribosomal protein L11 methyltransferase